MNRNALRTIILEGDAETTVNEADAFGKDLAKRHKVSTSQIRNIFGTVRRIEMTWPEEPKNDEQRQRAAQAQRELLLLKPKMAYQAKRARQAKPLTDVLTEAIDLVMIEEEKKRQRFQHLVDFFEATLAYHKFYGGKTD